MDRKGEKRRLDWLRYKTCSYVVAVFVQEASGERSVRNRNLHRENEKARRASDVLARLEKCVLFETKHFRGKVQRRQVNRAVIHLLC